MPSTHSGGRYSADSLHATGRLVAPGVSAVLASATPPAGVYEIRIRWVAGAGAVAVDSGNVRLDYNGVSSKIAAIPEGVELVLPRVTLDGTNFLRAVVVAAATATVPYSCVITYTSAD